MAGVSSSPRPPFTGGWSVFPPVIRTLLVVNGVVFLAANLLLAPFSFEGVSLSGLLLRLFALWPWADGFLPWQPLSYMFFHGSFFHLLFNMLGLWMFGMELENIWGSRKFLVYYLLGGVAGGLAHLLVGWLMGQTGPTIGASGAVFGVLTAFGILFPNRPIYLYFFFPVKAKYLVAGYIALELFYGITGTTDGVAHVAHLGGALLGALVTLGEMNVIPVRSWWAGLRPQAPAGRLRRTASPETEVRDARFHDIRPGRGAGREEEITQEAVDAILDKISAGGYQSLTEQEKRILTEASKKIH